MRDFFRRFDVDRLLPPNIRRDDPEELRRARVAIYFAIALILFSVQYAVTYAADGHYLLATWILGAASLALLTPFVLRARRPARAAGLYVPALWPPFLHAVRNAVDHGIEPPEERELRDKPRGGLLRFEASLKRGQLCVSLEDDGGGIDWVAIARKAALAGLPHATQADLQAAFFAEGISTRDDATDVSGRGVGTSALEAAVRALGGCIELRSEPARGTRISLHFEAGRRLGTHVVPDEESKACTGTEIALPPLPIPRSVLPL